MKDTRGATGADSAVAVGAAMKTPGAATRRLTPELRTGRDECLVEKHIPCWLTIDITTYVLKDLQHLFIVMMRLSIAVYPN